MEILLREATWGFGVIREDELGGWDEEIEQVSLYFTF